MDDLGFDFFIDDRSVGVVGSLDVIDEDTSVDESLSICIAWVVVDVVAGEISSMRTLDNGVVDDVLLPGLVRPSDDSGVLAGGLELQNEARVAWLTGVGFAPRARELVQPCSWSDVKLSPPSSVRCGEAVVSEFSLALRALFMCVGSIVD